MDTIDDMTEEQINARIAEIDADEKSVRAHRYANPVTCEDIEDISDNYQNALETGWYLDELADERRSLIQARNRLHMVE